MEKLKYKKYIFFTNGINENFNRFFFLFKYLKKNVICIKYTAFNILF